MAFLTDQAVRTNDIVRDSLASRSLSCFEVLDYDSLTNVRIVDKNNKTAYSHVVGLIYKKVTITHLQHRTYTLHKSVSNVFNNKDINMPVPPLTELDSTVVTDNYNYSGTRVVEYILCLVVDVVKYEKSLGTVSMGVTGVYNLTGENDQVVNGFGNKVISGPVFSVSGDRFYGVSVNVGLEALTYSYDVEGYKSGQTTILPDSPVNLEDYNNFWTKKQRVVGVMNYQGNSGSEEFSCNNFPDKIMAVGYEKTAGK